MEEINQKIKKIKKNGEYEENKGGDCAVIVQVN